MRTREPEDDLPDDAELRPSRSARKRAAEALQKLGEYLLTLRDSELRGLPLPEELLTALLEGQRVRSGPALARQKQYIGRLMRTVDEAALQEALAARPDAHRARARIPR